LLTTGLVSGVFLYCQSESALALLKQIDGAWYQSTASICNDLGLAQFTSWMVGPVVVHASVIGSTAWLYPHPEVK